MQERIPPADRCAAAATDHNKAVARFPPGVERPLLERGWRFYNFIGHGGARLMCAWDTTEDDVAHFVRDVRKLCEAAEPSA